MALLIAIISLAFAFWLLRRLSPTSTMIKALVVGGFVLVAFAADFWLAKVTVEDPTGAIETFADTRPIEEPQGDFVTSAACLECHQDNHASWAMSFHRTMTQVASSDNSMGPFTNQVVSFYEGRERYQMYEYMGLPWIRRLRMGAEPGPLDASAEAMPAVLTTGSHHMQAYWMPTGQGRMLALMPMVYVKEMERWIPRNAAFLRPPVEGSEPELGRWNTTCIKCHTTDGRMNIAEENGMPVIDSKASEFGISCESCHGAGRQHVAFQRAKAAGQTPAEADNIVNPASAPHRLSAQICGGCHSSSSNRDDPNDWKPYRVGDDLEAERLMLDFTDEVKEWMVTWGGWDTNISANVEDGLLQTFWKDGVVRVSGREYSSLRKTGCFTRGEMSCTSCHTLHASGLSEADQQAWTTDLLHPHLQGDASCTQCHEENRYAAMSHIHHAPASSGARCQNCHMPHTMYGLLKAERNHAIGSPTVRETVEYDRPNACNLCHLDKSLQWTADNLKEWYGQESPQLSRDEATLAAGAVWTMKGDASVRAIVGWHMGWDAAVAASGPDWMPPYLAMLMGDRYDVVRYIAGRSARSRGAYRDLEYDFLAPQEKRREQASELVERWRSIREPALAGRVDLLLDQNGNMIRTEFDRLLRERDNRNVFLAE